MYPNSHSSRSFGAISDTMLPAAMNSQQQQLPYSPTPRSPMSTWSSFSPNPTSALHPSDPETFIIEDGGYPCEDLRSKSRNLLAMLSASNHSRNEEDGSTFILCFSAASNEVEYTVCLAAFPSPVPAATTAPPPPTAAAYLQ
ncbi:hypothetical protein BASA61_005249 [Batrachochytrium salamandrivorans]|nr:hypothetical protein BASA61_005249 [Batrachochytrium salamandrivorans]